MHGITPLKLLALDTSTLQAALAVLRDDGATFNTHTEPTIRHGRALLPTLRDLLSRADLRPGDLDAVAVGLGPGSFTGLRIGLTAAKALAYAITRPLIGLDSFDALARNADDSSLRICVVADAQRGELFAAEYQRAAPGEPPIRQGPTRIVSSAPFCQALPDGTLVLGPALERPALALPDHLIRATPDQNHPHGLHLLALAHEAYLSGHQDDPWFLEPVYIRRSAAEEKQASQQSGNGIG